VPSIYPPSHRTIAPKRARRAFVGLAGSPLARVVADPTPPLSNAKRQQAFRVAKKAVEESNVPLQQKKWDKILANANLSADRGRYLADSPHGKGLPVHIKDANSLHRASARDKTQRGRVKPRGAASEATLARDSADELNRIVHGQRYNPLDEGEKLLDREFLHCLEGGQAKSAAPVGNLPKPEEQGWMRGSDGKWSKFVTGQKGTVERAK
jgi:hypothetical protein